MTHVHHQHAHQWLQSPNSDQSSYLDSQMISPGASYTLEMVYNGSGNRNKVVGDSIFHCHFYPHFAAGMWAMWRTHAFLKRLGTQDGFQSRHARIADVKSRRPRCHYRASAADSMAPFAIIRLHRQRPGFFRNSRSARSRETCTVNPGFPFFHSRVAARAPHPPLIRTRWNWVHGWLSSSRGYGRHSLLRESPEDWSKDLPRDAIIA